MMDMPKFEVVVTSLGAISIRNNIVNETMHNPVGPWTEANQLYIEASNFRARLTDGGDSPLVLFDVGLGAAANAIAAIVAAKETGSATNRRSLSIVSFENDLTLLQFVIENSEKIPYLAGYKEVLAELLEKREWHDEENKIDWVLYEGDFVEVVKGETSWPDIILYDPYSPGVNADMWSVTAFTNLYRIGARNPLGADLFTYSRATPVRTAMLMAGFYVGQGPSSGYKPETTQASTRLEHLSNPLDDRWVVRWLRSHTRHPLCSPDIASSVLTKLLLSHPQFAEFVEHSLPEWRSCRFAAPALAGFSWNPAQ